MVHLSAPFSILIYQISSYIIITFANTFAMAPILPVTLQEVITKQQSFTRSTEHVYEHMCVPVSLCVCLFSLTSPLSHSTLLHMCVSVLPGSCISRHCVPQSVFPPKKSSDAYTAASSPLLSFPPSLVLFLPVLSVSYCALTTTLPFLSLPLLLLLHLTSDL